MIVSYLGINISSWAYVSLLLFGLVIFIIIMIATEKERQRRHHRELHRMHLQMHQIAHNNPNLHPSEQHNIHPTKNNKLLR